MTDSNALSLSQQLALRVQKFCNNLGLTQAKLAKLLKVDDSQFSRFLAGKVNLSAEKTMKLMQLMSLTTRDLELKFGWPEKLNAKLHLQESGRKVGNILKFDSNGGWVPAEGMSGYAKWPWESARMPEDRF